MSNRECAGRSRTERHMTYRTERRKRNKNGRVYCIKTGFPKIFTNADLAAKVVQAVDLVPPILIAGSLLASLHVTRQLENDSVMSPLDVTFFSRCYAAATHSTGSGARQFDPASDLDLAETVDLYNSQLPPGYCKPERPTFILPVSIMR